MALDSTSRRTFLKTGPALAATFPSSRALATEAEPTVHGAPVGLQLYSLRQHLPKDVPASGTRSAARS
jgi:hypothetical protein